MIDCAESTTCIVEEMEEEDMNLVISNVSGANQVYQNEVITGIDENADNANIKFEQDTEFLPIISNVKGSINRQGAVFEIEKTSKGTFIATPVNKRISVKEGENFYKCELCGQRFAWKCKYLKHKYQYHFKRSAKRLGEKCKYCGKVCKTRNSLQTHVLIHSKLYWCDICEDFEAKDHANEHKRRPFCCNYCKTNFKTLLLLKRHLKTHY